MAKAIQIFLAHASEDKLQVRELHKKLHSKGFNPWLDEIDLLPGQNWQVEIPNAIRESDVFLGCLSKSSVAKQGYVQKEFRLALMSYASRPAEKIFFIPVKLDNCEIPRLQVPDLGIDIADFQWVELSSEDGFERLVRAIESVFDVFHPPGTENDRQLPFSKCRFEVNPKYSKTKRWMTLADVLVNLHSASATGHVYLIPSGLAPQSLGHTEILRSSAEALETKRAATEEFIKQNRDKDVEGKSFLMRTRVGECIAVYSRAYDRFLTEYVRTQSVIESED